MITVMRNALIIALAFVPVAAIAQQDPFVAPYAEHCAGCHGANLEGSPQGPPLVRTPLRHGEFVEEIQRSIGRGIAEAGMPAWAATLDATVIQRLAIYILEKRSDLSYTDFRIAAPPTVPTVAIKTEKQVFRVETVATGLDALPYSIAPLPDGRILLTEKTRGLSIVSADGKRSELIRGTPKAYHEGFEMPGVQLFMGVGYILDVALHPDYAKNGWIYLSYTDRCTDCNAASRRSHRPVSMNALVRGRIKNGEWIDQQTIWHTDVENYTGMPDMAAGGRIAFDGKGHVFMSIGIKDNSEFAGVQDLRLPYGKVLRLNDDGSIPADNPFVHTSGALAAIWTYGHRSPEGLEFDRKTGQLWETEMGQRGGDEVNLLMPGRNYGWPLYSKGLKYDGMPVDYGKDLGLDVDVRNIEQPVVDLTPSPAVSSFAIYSGPAFPRWRGDLLVGSLKATELYRMEIKNNRVIHIETLLKGLGRIRDVAVGPEGAVYLLLEHESGSRILKLVPAG